MTEPLLPELTGAEGGPDQKERLERAMLDAVAEHGFAATTVGELVKRARVSKSTFYKHFGSKEECFLATFDAIVAQVGGRVATAFAEPGELRERLVAALSAFMDLAVEQPEAISLAAIDSLTLGLPGVRHRELASKQFEALIGPGLAEEQATPMPAAALTLVDGVRSVAFRRLRAGTQAELPTLVEPLVDWALSYREPEGELARRAAAAAAEPAPPPPPAEGEEPDWDVPPDSPRARRGLNQRQRIVRGTVKVVLEGGYEALSIPAISAAAGVSNQTFYEHFSHKREPFMAAFEELVERMVAVAIAANAAGGDRPEALGMGIRAFLEQIAASEPLARIAFFELPVAGPDALDRGDSMLNYFTAFLQPGTAPREVQRPLPPVVVEALGGGIWGMLAFELSRGHRARLPELAPEVARLALIPLERSQSIGPAS